MAICWLAKQSSVTRNQRHTYSTNTASRSFKTYIVHIAQGGSCAGMKNWFETEEKRNWKGEVMPENQQFAGAHFGIEKNGEIVQFVDTQFAVYGAGPANDHAVNVENVGMPGDELTDAQVEANGNLLAWCNQVHGIPLRLNFLAPFVFSDV